MESYLFLSHKFLIHLYLKLGPLSSCSLIGYLKLQIAPALFKQEGSIQLKSKSSSLIKTKELRQIQGRCQLSPLCLPSFQFKHGLRSEIALFHFRVWFQSFHKLFEASY